MPSPRQNVEDEAEVPLFRLPTGRLPVTPDESGKPVQLVRVPDAGVPSTGAINVLLLRVAAFVAKTNVSATLAKSGNVSVVAPTVWAVTAMLTFWALFSTSGVGAVVLRLVADAAPSTGVTSVGLVDSTLFPLPVTAVAPVPPFRTGRLPETPVLSGSPVQLVSVPLVGVPSSGVTSVGLVAKTSDPLPVSSLMTFAS